MANDEDIAAGKPQRGILDPDEHESFRPGIRWRFWTPIVLFIGITITAYFVSEARRSRRLRAQLIAEHGLLTESLAPPYRALRAEIEQLTASIIAPWQGTYTEPGFTLSNLATDVVLYGRVRFGEIHRVGDVAASIRHRYPDQLAACVGIETNAVHQLYDRGEFLMPSYVESVRTIDSGNRLAALRQDLQYRLRRDTPDIVTWTRRRYFVLAVDEGAVSIDGPTRVYIWDLRDRRLVLRARGDAGDTVLIPIRIAGMPGGGRRIPQPTGALTLSQHDCAVANVVREQLGISILTMRSAPDVVAPRPTNLPVQSGDAAAGAAPPAPASAAATTAPTHPGG